MLAVIGATLASAQTLPPFKHIVIIAQENRTPDNLFGSGAASHVGACGTQDGFELGVDLQDGGLNEELNGQISCLTEQPLSVCWDPTHSKDAWDKMADIQLDGTLKMDGACEFPVHNASCTTLQCPAYTYVHKTDVQPYFDIAANYGFANYFFQTNEGPSFPAHQFLLAGTSAPVPPLTSNYLDFVSDNAPSQFLLSGCPDATDIAQWVDPTAKHLHGSLECYDHQTLVDLLDAATSPTLSWRYYTPYPDGIWTAVNAIQHLCYKQGSGPPAECNSTDWNNVIWPGKGGSSLTPAIPFLTDVQNCNLPNVSWVIPDKLWSDHPDQSNGSGPSYVADLVDAIGNSTCPDGGQTYWQDTAIFITWDDWGGFYDHVPPPIVQRDVTYSNNNNNCPDPKAQWGCGYTYGFRVPLLVVSAYTKAGYVSGGITGAPVYPPPKEWTHDFGSILAFIEHNFNNLGPIDQPYYADFNAMDSLGGTKVPLWDFFQWSYKNFVPISPASGLDANYFQNYYVNNNVTPMGPDGGDED